MDASWLKVKTAGLPRWAWISLLSGGVILGLYLRSRNASETEPEEEEEQTPEGLESYEGTETASSLGSVGLAGPASGQVVPVEAPFLPEGFTDLLAQQGAANVEAQQSIAQLASDAINREPSERVETIVEREPSESNQGVTGGGAPKRKPHHKAPKKHKPKQHKKPHHKKPHHKKPHHKKPHHRRQKPHHNRHRKAGHHAR